MTENFLQTGAKEMLHNILYIARRDYEHTLLSDFSRTMHNLFVGVIYFI